MTLAAMLVLVLFVAWWDGGREEQRLVAQPVTVPELNT